MTTCHAQRRLRAALGAALLSTLLLTLLPAAARGHWVKPEEIIAGLNQDPVLRDRLGVVQAYADPKLPRLLVIKVQRDIWEKVAAEKRLGLSQLWYETWHHNVDQGIVAVLDAKTDKSLVHYDANGLPQLVSDP